MFYGIRLENAVEVEVYMFTNAHCSPSSVQIDQALSSLALLDLQTFEAL